MGVTETLLTVRGLAVELQGHEALTDVSFDVKSHSCMGLVGETGAGKSLTGRALTGLLRRIGARTVRGTALFDGIDLLSRTEKQWRALRGRRISMVPQSSLSGLDPLMRIGAQLEETIHELDKAVATGSRALELLELVHMPRAAGVLRLYPHELSGGMRQRVMIALALAGRPELLLADEPTTALDVTVQRGIIELLTDLRRETGMALILVTHDLTLIESIGDTVAIMYGGMVVETGPAQTVLTSPAHPYTRALLAARPSAARKGERLMAIPGGPPGIADRPAGCPFAPRCPYVKDVCRTDVPRLEPVTNGHIAACWRAGELSP
jgi:oligopeptide/dipeptide ABC transporter ATP-binding protein